MRSVTTVLAAEPCSELRVKTQSSLIKSLGALATVLLLASGFSVPAFAEVTENTDCVLDQPAYGHATVNCTAGDLGLSTPVTSVVKACNFPGDTAILDVTVDITTTATARYDMGLWFSVDGDPNGDGSQTGTCTVVSIPNTLFDADGVSVNKDGDFCGDVVSTAVGPPDIADAALVQCTS